MGESHEKLDMGFQQGNQSIMNCHSSGLSANSQAQKAAGMAMSSLTMARASDGHGPDSFLGSWDPLGSLSQTHSEFTSSYPVALGNQGINNASHLVEYGTSDSSFADLVPKIHGFGSGNFSEMVGSFGPSGCSELINSGYRHHYNPNKEVGIENSSVHPMQSQNPHLCHKEEIMRSVSNGNKRKRDPEPISSSSPNKNTEGEELKDATVKCSNRKEQEEKSRIEQQSTSDLRGKQTVKQDKDDSHSGEAPKETFVHIRARRGQATNSHSLAERVRREKISERMRLLQELVPGCNKITGKAVMLDEIINYVQSLQQQVEFLSMKLATVNPEMNFDIERILSKDILHSRMGNGAIFGLGTGMNYSLPFPQPTFPGTHPSIPSATAQFPLPPTMADQDFQSMLQMGYDSTAAIDTLGSNGRLKSEL